MNLTVASHPHGVVFSSFDFLVAVANFLFSASPCHSLCLAARSPATPTRPTVLGRKSSLMETKLLWSAKSFGKPRSCTLATNPPQRHAADAASKIVPFYFGAEFDDVTHVGSGCFFDVFRYIVCDCKIPTLDAVVSYFAMGIYFVSPSFFQRPWSS